LNLTQNADQMRFAALIADPRLTPDMMLEVMNDAIGLEPLPGLVPIPSRGIPPRTPWARGNAAWPKGALADVIARNGLGTLCDALEERLELLTRQHRRWLGEPS
jgi:hypothetical protein